MKIIKMLLIAAFVSVFANTAYSQLYLSGMMKLNSNKHLMNGQMAYESVYLSIIPDIGYYVSERHAIGLSVGLDLSWNTNYDNGEALEGHDHDFMIMPFYRWDFVKKEKFSLGIKTSAFFTWSSYDQQDGSGKEKDYDLLVTTKPIIEYRFNEHWSAVSTFGELGFGFSTVNTEDDAPKANLIAKANTSTLIFGVVYRFR